MLAAIACLCAAVLPGPAGAAVYWDSEVDGLDAANLDGSNPQWGYFPPMGGSGGVAVNSEFIFSAGSGGIARRRLDPAFYPATIVSNLEGPEDLSLDGAHLYWTTTGGESPAGPRPGSVGRANLDGSEANAGFIGGLDRPCGVAVDGSHVYWLEERGIGRANLDGSSPERSFIPLLSWDQGCGLAASDGYLYWGQDEAVARADLQTGEVDDAFIPQAGALEAITVAAGHIYWVRMACPPGTSASIGRANIDGSESDPAWIPSNERWLGGVAVDERPTPPYLLLPSRSVRLVTNLRYNLRSGAVLLGVYVPWQGPLSRPWPPQGRLAVTSPGVSWTVFTSTEPHPAQGGMSLWQVRIRSGSGPIGRRIRAQLRRRGWAPVNVRLIYEGQRSFPVEAGRRLILRRYRGAPAGWVKHPGRPPRAHRR